MKFNNKNGFTLIESIIVILIIAILSFVIINVLRGPMRAFVDAQNRAQLVDIAETALTRMTREIRLALPNSVRVNGAGTAIEFLRTRDGGRYRNEDANKLKITEQTDTFEFLGPLNQFAAIQTGAGGQGVCMAANSAVDCLVIYNTGQPNLNAYSGDNIAAINAKAGSTLTYDLSPVTEFPFPSRRHRFFVVDTPVSFICSGSAIRRYFDYLIQDPQPVPPGTGTSNLLVNQVTNCTMEYDAGSETRSGLATISITIQDNEIGQSVTLIQQAHVDNAP
ncbi:MAG: prepilin-type N-terminal cleavage/methylation domain-containing protein, partial [Proteobacteria bacterium]|nr:prepilin-type N-terminal cleavage/methylation domain-containing protein [Pseudomonadota bacterium]